MGIGDWGLGIGDWGLGPIPNPQSPIPNPHPQCYKKKLNNYLFLKFKESLYYIILYNAYSFKIIY
jgi:hypothetical protein